MQIGDVILSNPTLFRRVMSLYPPYVGAGIRVTRVSDNFREIDVELRLRKLNRNAMGTHFGGSLYAMTDPFYALMYIANLGPRYNIWDYGAKIEFKRPGTGVVHAQFRLSSEDIDLARQSARDGTKYLPVHHIDICDSHRERVAVVEKQIYIRKKHLKPTPVRVTGGKVGVG